MKAWAFVENGKPLTQIEVTVPEPVDEQVLVETTHCGVCHSDLYFQDGYYELGGGKRLSLADRGVKLPLVPGHEVVGRVVKMGPKARGVKVGDLRLVYPWGGCGACAKCRSDNPQLCQSPNSVGVWRKGGYGSHVIVHTPDHLLDIGGVDPALAATYACSGITAYSAVKKLSHLSDDDPMVVIGVGGLGLAAISVLKAFGRKKIIGVDISEAKRKTGLATGATVCLDGNSPTLTADLTAAAAGSPLLGVVDFVASTRTAEASIAALGRGGKYVPVGLYGGDLVLPLPTVPLRSLCIEGSYTGSLQEMRELMQLAISGKLAPTPVEEVAHQNPNVALDRVRAGAVEGRLVLSVQANARS